MKNSKDFIMVLLIATLFCLGGYTAYDYFYLNNQKVCQECKKCEACEACSVEDDYLSWCEDEDNCYEEVAGKKFYQVLDKLASKNNVPGVLELKKDNTFIMDVNMCEYIGEMQGTYEVDKDELILHYTDSDSTVMIPEEMVFNIVSGDQIIYKGEDPITCDLATMYVTKDLINSLTKDYSN